MPGTELQLNADRTVTVPLKGRDAVVLEEPSFTEMADIHDWMVAADAAVEARTWELFNAQSERAEDDTTEPLSIDVVRNTVRFGRESPYVALLQRVISTLTGEEVDAGNLYGWAGSHRTVGQMFAHWQDPLGGQVSREQIDQLLRTLQQGQPQPATTNGS